MVIVAMPKAELADRTVDGIIVVPEGTDITQDLDGVIGRIMFESNDFQLGRGFNNGANKRVYFEAGYVPDLQAVIKALGLKAGKEFTNYRLVIKESTEPFFDNQQPKIYPEGHPREGEECTHQGAPIYRRTIMVNTLSKELDEMLELDRLDAVASPSPAAGMSINVNEFGG